jgi:circadian clock protein KaiB
MKKSDRLRRTFEETVTAKTDDAEHYVLRLYVTGMTPRSAAAIATIRTLCAEHLEGRYELEVIDIYQHPTLARDEQIIAAPTLVKKLPPPLRRMIGNLSDAERVLMGLDLRRRNDVRDGEPA